MDVEYGHFPSRDLRTEYVASRFDRWLKGRVLDVGCDRAVLKKLRPQLDYFGIDVGGTPDLVVDLEKVGRLPFEDRSFDVVLCADVLEHLANIHFVFGELLRVTRSAVILSLPNNWSNARRAIERGRGTIGHYGLPVDPPVDRHKWFFSLTEAREFIEGSARRHGATVASLHAMEKPRLAPVQWLRRARFPNQACYLNRYSHTLWAVVTPAPGSPPRA